jgi:hypothetical protein
MGNPTCAPKQHAEPEHLECNSHQLPCVAEFSCWTAVAALSLITQLISLAKTTTAGHQRRSQPHLDSSGQQPAKQRVARGCVLPHRASQMMGMPSSLHVMRPSTSADTAYGYTWCSCRHATATNQNTHLPIWLGSKPCVHHMAHNDCFLVEQLRGLPHCWICYLARNKQQLEASSYSC